MFWFYGCETWGILTPWPGIEQTHTPVLKGEVLTTRPPICHFKFGLFFDKHVLLTFQPHLWSSATLLCIKS